MVGRKPKDMCARNSDQRHTRVQNPYLLLHMECPTIPVLALESLAWTMVVALSLKQIWTAQVLTKSKLTKKNNQKMLCEPVFCLCFLYAAVGWWMFG